MVCAKCGQDLKEVEMVNIGGSEVCYPFCPACRDEMKKAFKDFDKDDKTRHVEKG